MAAGPVGIGCDARTKGIVVTEVPDRPQRVTDRAEPVARPVQPVTAVRVRAPARLHFGFLDLHGGLGRRFGSIGVAVDTPAIDLTVTAASHLAASGPEAGRALAYARAAALHLGVPAQADIRIDETIRPHAGFGSGTQLALSVAAALARLNGRSFRPQDFADALDRGNRSGVGLAAFTEGGLIVDGGRDAGGGPPPVIARLSYPEAWRIVLIVDTAMTGVHGSREVEAFRDLPRFPEAQAAEICRIVLMQVLPAAATAEPQGFGEGIGAIQRLIGDHFAPHQGGRFASPAVAEALAAIAGRGIPGHGQSSWGPTGFALLPSEAQARALVAALERPGPLRFLIARGRNEGASVTTP